MVNYEITKKTKILEVNNELTHNYYYLVYGKIYNEKKTQYRRFKYVLWFDIFDLQEYFDKNFITKDDIKIFLNDIENPFIINLKSFDDKEGLKELYNFCNETIKNFNNIYK